MLQAAAVAHAGRIVQATSLGAEDMVITDLIARLSMPVAIGTLETGMLHAETQALIPAIEQRYGVKVEIYQPRDEAVIEFVGRNGPKAMYQSIELRKGCCGIRKLEPLSRMLAGRTAWITGLRREQSDNRGNVRLQRHRRRGPRQAQPAGRLDLGRRVALHPTREVPYNPLHDRFYPSIGCEPCTRAIALGEDFRAGRWWWEDERRQGMRPPRGADQETKERRMNAPLSIEQAAADLDNRTSTGSRKKPSSSCARSPRRSSGPALLFSGGKDSCVVLRLAEKAFKTRVAGNDSRAACPSRCCTWTPGTTFPR